VNHDTCLRERLARALLGIALLLSALTGRAPGQSTTESAGARDQNAIRKIDVDFAKVVGRIRPLHGVNCGPLAEAFTIDLSWLFHQLDIPYVRLIAPNWPGTDCVQINFVFPDFDADPADSANYDFEKTDDYIAAVLRAGARPIYSLGYTAERDVLGNKYKKHNVPPKDFQKWATICVNIIRHYNDGWADGHHWDIKYWEVWNEPDNYGFWTGTVEQYADLYEIVSKMIKAHDSKLKVGGPGIASNLSWLDKFLGICAQRKLALDFCSWHCYHPTPSGSYLKSFKVEELLKRHGFTDTESHLGEWSPVPLSWREMRSDPFKAREFFTRTGSAEGGAFDVALLTFLQDSPVDIATFYSGDTLRWGFADRNGAPKTSFYAFKAFAKTLDTPVRVSVTGDDKEHGLAVLAGISEDRSRASILISNHAATYRRYELTLRNVPWKDKTTSTTYLVDDQHALKAVGVKRLEKAKVLQLSADAPAPSVCLLRLNEPANLALRCPVKASSCSPPRPGSEKLLVDGNLSRHPGQFWASDPAKERISTMMLDLGAVQRIRDVRLWFRNLNGRFGFVPQQVVVAVSDDGREFNNVLESRDVPQEGAPYVHAPRIYAVQRTGRYLRVSVGPSQRTGSFAGMNQLFQIQVLGR